MTKTGNNGGNRLYTGTFLVMNLVNFLLLTGNSLYVLFPLELQSFGMDDTKIGLVMGSFFISGMIARFIAGPLIDSRGRRYFVRMGIIVYMVCALLYMLPETILLPHRFYGLWYFIAVRALHGFGHGFYFTSAFTWAADYAPAGRVAESIGIFGVSGLLTISSGSLIGESILHWFNGEFFYLFLVHFFLVLCGYLLSAYMKDVHTISHRKSFKDFLGHFKKSNVILASMVAATFGLGVTSINIFMAPYSRLRGIGDVSYFFTAYAAAAVIVRLVSRKMGDTMDRRNFIVPGFLMMALGLSYAHLAGDQGSLVIIGLMAGSSHGLLYPSLSTLMLDGVGNHSRGTGTGVFNAAIDVGNMSGAYLAGMLADLWGPGAMFGAMAILVVSGLLSFYLFSHPDGERQNGNAAGQIP